MAQLFFFYISGVTPSCGCTYSFWKGRLILRSKDPALKEDFPLPPLPTYKASCPDGVDGGGAPSAPVIKRGSLINFMGALATKGQYIYPDDLRPWVLGGQATSWLTFSMPHNLEVRV